jgi:diguanylate cyclase (GGDEF)-like protein
VSTSPRPEPGNLVAAFRTSADALARGADLDATIESLLGAGVDTTGADAGTVFLQDPDRNELELATGIGLDEAALVALREAVRDPEHPVGALARGHLPSAEGTRTTEDGRSWIDLPLVVSRGGIDLALGVVSFGWLRGATPDEERGTVLAAVADLIAVGVDHARLASMVAERADWFERLAHTDPLTGLANLRTFGRVLELELARAGRQGGQVSVAILDIDDFAATNEDAGRDAGDDVLRAVASVVAESVRLVDTVARYGGDEFVLVAPGSAGPTVAQRIIDGVAALPPVGGRPVSVSAGVARFPDDGMTTQDLLGAAEAALGEARTTGPGRLGASAAVGEQGASIADTD